MIDTGVDAAHADLAGRVVPGQDFVNSALDGTTDCHGHGTHVAGILAADDNSIGVVGGTPESTIVAVRVLDKSGSGTLSAVANGILWASDPTKGNATVISMSLGASSGSSVLSAAVATAISRGVVVVAAAGNSGGSTPIYPAAYPGVLAVGALCQTGTVTYCANTFPSDPYQLATFSNHAPSGVDAAGVNINSTWNTGGYSVLSGTSMATPFVAAVAALVRAACPNDTQTDVVSTLQQTAHDLGTAGLDAAYGYGGVDANAALSLACKTP